MEIKIERTERRKKTFRVSSRNATRCVQWREDRMKMPFSRGEAQSHNHERESRSGHWNEIIPFLVVVFVVFTRSILIGKTWTRPGRVIHCLLRVLRPHKMAWVKWSDSSRKSGLVRVYMSSAQNNLDSPRAGTRRKRNEKLFFSPRARNGTMAHLIPFDAVFGPVTRARFRAISRQFATA